MHYTIDLLPSDNIIRLTWHTGFDFKRDLPEMEDAVNDLIDTMLHGVTLIIDMSAVSSGLANIIQGMTFAVNKGDGLFTHPYMREVIIVSQAKAIELGATRLTNGANVTVLPTAEDAMAYAFGQYIVA